MDSNEDKLYIRIIALDEIYIFVVQKFLNWNCLGFENIVVSAHILKFKIINDLRYWHGLYKIYSSQYSLQFCSWKVFYLKSLKV